MDLKQIERLMAVMGRSGIKRMALKQEGFEIELERECAGSSQMSYATPSYAPPPPVFSHAAPQQMEESAKQAPSSKKEEGRFVTSPIVGTFYSSPSPDAPPFVRLGDEVDEESVVCIVEAMKVMNEVKAGVRGKVAEILLKNGDPVQFGTNIIRVV